MISGFRICVILHLFLLLSCDKGHEALQGLPVVNLTANHADLFSDSIGIYVEGIGTASDWQGERANFFDKRRIEGNFTYEIDGEVVINQPIFLRISGGGSRKNAQKSFNLYADKSLGVSHFEFPFFTDLKDSHFNTLRLRNSGQDWNRTHMRDALMHSLVKDLDVYVQAYQPVIVYLNNQYWGIYNLREKFNKNYIRRHQHLSNEVKFDIMERHHQVDEGSADDYLSLIDYLNTHDLKEKKNLDYAISQIDTSNFIDYYCSQIYFANTDWPGNNIKYWKAKLPESKWNWFMHDTDLGFALAPIFSHPGGVDHNTLVFNLNDQKGDFKNQPWSTLLFRKLTENEEFRMIFEQRLRQLLKNEFSPNRVLTIIDGMQAQLRPEMERHIERWKVEDPVFYQSIPAWESEVEVLRDFARKRADIVSSHLDEW
jgi:hypothetical protein